MRLQKPMLRKETNGVVRRIRIGHSLPQNHELTRKKIGAAQLGFL